MSLLNFKRRWLAVALLLTIAAPAMAGEPETNFIARAEAEFHRTQAQYQLHTNDSAAAQAFARACFTLADLATNDFRRAGFAKQGIAVCQQWLARESNSAPAHYYLAMNDGKLAQAEAPSLAAYRLVRVMEREFKQAAELDERVDYAGPDRSLGLLYRDAPGWPLSIGSRRKAREWLERAVRLAPNFPENRLVLIESRLKWNDRPGAESELQSLDALWPSARTNFTGAAWAQSWDDWTSRREAAQKKLDEAMKAAKK